MKGKKVKIGGVIALVTVLIALVINEGLAVDLRDLIREAKAKYSKFEKAVKDMIILLEIKRLVGDREMTSQMRVIKKGKKYRTETTMMGMQIITIYDGKDTWMISPMTGKKRLSPEERKGYQTAEEWFNRISERAKIIGTERIKGQQAYVIQVEEPEAPFIKLWVDKKRLVMLKAISRGPQGQEAVILCSDYRKIKNGWEMPYKTEVYRDDKLITSFTVKSIEINKGISDELFDPNKAEVKGPTLQEMMKKMMPKE